MLSDFPNLKKNGSIPFLLFIQTERRDGTIPFLWNGTIPFHAIPEPNTPKNYFFYATQFFLAWSYGEL